MMIDDILIGIIFFFAVIFFCSTYSKEEVEKKVSAFRKMLFEKEGIADLAGKATPERAK